MKISYVAFAAVIAASAAKAEEARQMDAHVHGVSSLELALEAGALEINLTSPGADIVGFEYAAATEAEKDAVDAAIRIFAAPENVLALPEAAGCRLTEVLAHLHAGDAHGHAHEDEHEHEHEHGEEHEHAEGDDHDHGDEHEHAEGEKHDHAEHAEGAVHSEFHARYSFDCAHPEELTSLGLPFFERFENAQEIEAQFVTEAGAGAAEIGRDAAELSLN
ncbi:zinc uptake protein ZrgA [Roseovarius aquimarinus]|uniref:DUF2796 domain-containing protein n=1 Tax=Roseovarius aquimarinus TaxID=1229156 RepID=A0ABW7I584_9RHOB